jgi:3'-5' exoribonuclease
VKSQFVAELAEGSRVDTTFVLRAKEMRATRAGEAFLALEFADRTGQLQGVWFHPDAASAAVPVSTVVHVRGTVTRYRSMKRISVDSLKPEATWDPGDFLERGRRDQAEMIAALRSLVASVSDRALGLLLRRAFGDKDFFARFVDCPAAQSYHHACLGGLLEHTVSVASMCAYLSDVYEGVDRDLLVTAALLHDIGKVDELRCDTSIEYTDEGRLIGHLVLGMRRITDAARRSGASLQGEVLLRLEHAVLSHHGELEWGSPKRPSTIEALLLHHADNLDAKASGFGLLLTRASRAEEVWTDATNLFRRPLYAPRPAEDERARPIHEEGQHLGLSA